jgi:hypothetical protein
MSKNSDLMQQQMEKHPDMRLVVEQEENPPVIHEKRNGYARIARLDPDAANVMAQGCGSVRGAIGAETVSDS